MAGSVRAELRPMMTMLRPDFANRFAIANYTLKVRVKDKLAALWPFLGIVGEVAILVTVIFLYERHQLRKQRQQEEADDFDEQRQALQTANGDGGAVVVDVKAAEAAAAAAGDGLPNYADNANAARLRKV